MDWSTTVPSIDGYYYWREDADWTEPMLVRVRRNWSPKIQPPPAQIRFFVAETLIAKAGDDHARPYKTPEDLGGEWCGPLLPPSGTPAWLR